MATYRLTSNYPVPGKPDYPELKIGTIIEGEEMDLPNLKVRGISYYHVVTGKPAVALEIPITKLFKISDINISSGGTKKVNYDFVIKYGSIALFAIGIILILSSLIKRKKN